MLAFLACVARSKAWFGIIGRAVRDEPVWDRREKAGGRSGLRLSRRRSRAVRACRRSRRRRSENLCRWFCYSLSQDRTRGLETWAFWLSLKKISAPIERSIPVAAYCGNGHLHWPHRGTLNWLHPALVVGVCR